MACLDNFFFLFLPLFFLISGTLSQNPVLPTAAILSVTKDLSSLQYVTKVLIGQDLTPIDLVVDLNGPNVWFACGSSSDFGSEVERLTLKCSMANPIRVEGSSSKICALKAENTITGVSASGELNEGSMALEFWEGKSLGLGSFAKNEHFLFPFAPNFLLKGLASGAKGMLGLGNSRISVLSQFSRAFGFLDRKFSMCLSSSGGAIFLGGSPSGSEISSSMMYTPLISRRDGYLLNVKSIKVFGKKLSLHRKGILETRISTTVPYTTIESKIYVTFVEAYISAAIQMNLTRVAAVAPFDVCFRSEGDGANVPSVDLVLQSEMVKWRMDGRNLMVVSDEVMCLGMLDGGLEQKEAIVIGGYQLEDCLLEFNLGTSMLGFSSTLQRCPGFESASGVL